MIAKASYYKKIWEMKNKRRKVHEELEVVQTGFANGVAKGFPLEQSEKDKMIDEAEEAYGKFLDA